VNDIGDVVLGVEQVGMPSGAWIATGALKIVEREDETRHKFDYVEARASKDAARSEAIRRWPNHAGLFARVKDDGRAEAALIAVAGLLRGQASVGHALR
jgi:hypothetical protein